jgi:selenocysteine lyase/cysteine desulfurase
LPWRESVADLVEIALDGAGGIDLTDLERRMKEYEERPLKIGSFSAASNVTGLLSDVRGISRVLHGGGALAIFDYAAAAPYVPINMHPGSEEERIDALFLSAHKFIGGPQSSGLLVANRCVFLEQIPADPGGGTVDYVAGPGPDDVDYVGQLNLREEAGTPAIMGDITAGAAFLVKQMLGPARIESHEIAISARAVARLAAHARITVLGPHDLPRLAIVPITIEGLHHDFASALLDHLFGIQNRGGCSCAGPYGHRLLGIDRETSNRFRALVRRGIQGMKPGWVRLALPYYASDDDLDFILTAVEFVADHGDEFLPAYRLDWRRGVWRHVERDVEEVCPIDLSIDSLLSFAGTIGEGSEEPAPSESRIQRERARYLDEARRAADRLRRQQAAASSRFNPPTGDRDIDELVWFRFVHAGGL